MHPDCLDILARTIWGEARGTGIAGMQHVASVILNRASHPRWWGSDVLTVCLKPYQFSCWNEGDPNCPKVHAVTADDRQFAQALVIAAQALSGTLIDQTGGADSYYALNSRAPHWSYDAHHTMSDGYHTFSRVELPAPHLNHRVPGVTNLPIHPQPANDPRDNMADELNAAELERIRRQRD